MFRIETGDGYGGVRERRMRGTRGFIDRIGGISKTSSSPSRRGWTWEEGLDSLERVAAHDAVALELGVDVEAPDVGHGVSHATEPSRPCVVVNERRRFKRAPGCRFLGAII